MAFKIRMPLNFLEKNPSLTWLFILLYMGLIFYLSSIPYATQPKPLKGVQEAPILEHILEFAILGFLLVPGFKGLRVRRFLLLALVVGILYGVTDEVHQIFVPGRYPSLIDVLADSLGVFLGVLATKIT